MLVCVQIKIEFKLVLKLITFGAIIIRLTTMSSPNEKTLKCKAALNHLPLSPRSTILTTKVDVGHASELDSEDQGKQDELH